MTMFSFLVLIIRIRLYLIVSMFYFFPSYFCAYKFNLFAMCHRFHYYHPVHVLPFGNFISCARIAVACFHSRAILKNALLRESSVCRSVSSAPTTTTTNFSLPSCS